MKTSSGFCFLVCGYFALSLVLANGVDGFNGNRWPKSVTSVQYSVLSQRRLTKEERDQFQDALGLTIAVRLRLSNKSKNYFYYLSSKDSFLPEGYQLHRKLGKNIWRYVPPRSGNAKLGSEFLGPDYTWLELPPGAALEFEIFDWSNRGEEHAFSTFVKTDLHNEPIEIVCNTFRPLAK